MKILNNHENYHPLKELKYVIKNDEIRKFSGKDRQLYRILIVQTFVSAWTNDRIGYYVSSKELLKMIDTRDTNYRDLQSEEYKKNKESWCRYLYEEKLTIIKQENRKFIVNNSRLKKAVQFCNNFFKYYSEENQVMYNYNVIHEFWDLEKLYAKRTPVKDIRLLASSWIDLSPFLHQMPIYTFPDYLAYQDMINLWNDVIDKNNKMYNETEDNLITSIYYSLSTSAKYSIVSAVHFVEIYLFYFFYLCKLEDLFPENILMKSDRIRSITDKQIIDNFLFKEFVDAENKLVDQYIKYKLVLDIRDAIVHLSPFKEDESNRSRIELTMNLDINTTAEYLNNCYEFVIAIDEVINMDLLFWHKYMTKPNFKGLTKISNLNNQRK